PSQYRSWRFSLLAGDVQACCSRRRVKVNILLCGLVAELPQRREIIQDPEGMPVRGQHEIIVFHYQIMYGSGRQVQLQRTPVCAVVERNVNASLGSGV